MLVLLTTAASDQQNDVGYNAMQVNYELLNKSIDPQNVLGSMFAHKLLSFDEKKKITSTQEERGNIRACERMLDILFNKWETGTCERFIQVLENCNYKECAAQLQSNYTELCKCMYSLIHRI